VKIIRRGDIHTCTTSPLLSLSMLWRHTSCPLEASWPRRSEAPEPSRRDPAPELNHAANYSIPHHQKQSPIGPKCSGKKQVARIRATGKLNSSTGSHVGGGYPCLNEEVQRVHKEISEGTSPPSPLLSYPSALRTVACVTCQ
jgi:hypothetical protein